MKLALLTAVLLPIGYAIWNNVTAPAPTPTEHSTAVSDSPAAVSAPNPGAANEPSVTHLAELDAKLEENSLEPQEGPVLRVDRPLVRLDVVGPAAFRDAFLRTNIGDLFASVEGEQLWRPLLAPVEHLWRQWDGGGDDFEATRQRVLAYTGRIRVLGMVKPGEGRERDRAFGVFALETDGSTDLFAFAGDLSRVLQSLLPNELTKRSVGEHSLQLLGDPGSGFVTIPMVIGGSLVMFFGEASLEETVARGLRALAQDTEPSSAPVSLHVDLTQLKGLAEIRANPPLVRAFGLESLQTLHATVRPNGVHAQLEVEVVFGEGHRGLMAAFLPAVSTLPSLLARVPVEATPWLAVPFRPDVLYQVGVTTAADYNALDPNATPDLRQENYDDLGMYLDTELLDHLGGEVMVLGDLWQSGDSEVFRDGDDPPLGACIAMSVKDATAFGKGFGKLLDHLKGIVNVFETREVDGVKITRLGAVIFTGIHMALGDDLVAVATGREGVAQLEALVAGSQEKAARPLPAAVQNVQHLAPAGWNGVGLANLGALFGGQVTLTLEMLDDALPRQMGFDFSIDETQERLDRLLPVIAENELDNLVTMTGYDDGCWRLRLLW